MQDEIEYHYVRGRGWVASYKVSLEDFKRSDAFKEIQDWYRIRTAWARDVRSR